MITVSTTSREEAQAAADLLAAMTPRDWDYEVYLQGHLFAARDRRAPGQDAHDSRQLNRSAAQLNRRQE